jgi:ABC-2 type transport system permease protein
MVRWHLASLRMWLVTLTVVQLLAGVGFVLGISLFFAHIPTTAALFVSTGVPVINLLTVGLILGRP